MTGYTKAEVDEMRANLCARWESEWALLECRISAAEMLRRLYDAWRDNVSQADDLRKQRDEARFEVARLKKAATPYMEQIMAECDCDTRILCTDEGLCVAARN